MNRLTIFYFHDELVRAAVIQGENCFIGHEVAAALGYRDIMNAVEQFVPREEVRRLTLPFLGNTWLTETLVTLEGARKLASQIGKEKRKKAFLAWLDHKNRFLTENQQDPRSVPLPDFCQFETVCP
ncbi:MAG: hypothetical protein IJQ31_00360 [Thermoguttaceae bacterium]|nr:hypothetical protein [Thermoguttaceae bacterium]